MAFRSTARLLAPKIQYEPPYPMPQSTRLASSLVDLLRRRGAQTSAQLWDASKRGEVGMGFAAKWHMKQLLKWMKQQGMVCTRLPSPDSESRVYDIPPPADQKDTVSPGDQQLPVQEAEIVEVRERP